MVDDQKPWWFPVRTDAKWCARIRNDYPEDAGVLDDETIRDEYADGWKYADTWDHLGDARSQFEELADSHGELLEALQQLLDFPADFFDRPDDETVPITITGRHLRMARAAVQKAIGEAASIGSTKSTEVGE